MVINTCLVLSTLFVAERAGTFIWSFFIAGIAGGLGTIFFSRLKKSGEGEG